MPLPSRLRSRPPAVVPAERPDPSPVRLLETWAEARPDLIFLQDLPGRASWSGRAPATFGFGAAASAVRRLGDRFRALPIPEGAGVGICLPGGSEASLALFAVLAAGFRPCLLPLHLTDADLGPVLDRAGVVAVLTQARVGDLRPAELFCGLAQARFRLRFLLAFGPDAPDGVLDLDAEEWPASAAPSRARAPSARDGIVTLSPGPGGLAPALRGTGSFLALAAGIARVADIRPGDGLLSTLVPDDLKGLCTGPLAALVAGATLEASGLPDAGDLAHARRDRRTHVVLPGWAEPIVHALGLGDRAESLILVHDAATAWPSAGAEPLSRAAIVDVLAFGELALVAAPRDASGRRGVRREGGGDGSSIEWRLGDDGRMEVRGSATCAVEITADGSSDRHADPAVWRDLAPAFVP